LKLLSKYLLSPALGAIPNSLRKFDIFCQFNSGYYHNTGVNKGVFFIGMSHFGSTLLPHEKIQQDVLNTLRLVQTDRINKKIMDNLLNKEEMALRQQLQNWKSAGNALATMWALGLDPVRILQINDQLTLLRQASEARTLQKLIGKYLIPERMLSLEGFSSQSFQRITSSNGSSDDNVADLESSSYSIAEDYVESLPVGYGLPDDVLDKYGLGKSSTSQSSAPTTNIKLWPPVPASVFGNTDIHIHPQNGHIFFSGNQYSAGLVEVFVYAPYDEKSEPDLMAIFPLFAKIIQGIGGRGLSSNDFNILADSYGELKASPFIQSNGNDLDQAKIGIGFSIRCPQRYFSKMMDLLKIIFNESNIYSTTVSGSFAATQLQFVSYMAQQMAQYQVFKLGQDIGQAIHSNAVATLTQEGSFQELLEGVTSAKMMRQLSLKVPVAMNLMKLLGEVLFVKDNLTILVSSDPSFKDTSMRVCHEFFENCNSLSTRKQQQQKRGQTQDQTVSDNDNQIFLATSNKKVVVNDTEITYVATAIRTVAPYAPASGTLLVVGRLLAGILQRNMNQLIQQINAERSDKKLLELLPVPQVTVMNTSDGSFSIVLENVTDIVQAVDFLSKFHEGLLTNQFSDNELEDAKVLATKAILEEVEGMNPMTRLRNEVIMGITNELRLKQLSVVRDTTRTDVLLATKRYLVGSPIFLTMETDTTNDLQTNLGEDAFIQCYTVFTKEENIPRQFRENKSWLILGKEEEMKTPPELRK